MEFSVAFSREVQRGRRGHNPPLHQREEPLHNNIGQRGAQGRQQEAGNNPRRGLFLR
jgi:hypothetical protein